MIWWCNGRCYMYIHIPPSPPHNSPVQNTSDSASVGSEWARGRGGDTQLHLTPQPLHHQIDQTCLSKNWEWPRNEAKQNDWMTLLKCRCQDFLPHLQLVNNYIVFPKVNMTSPSWIWQRFWLKFVPTWVSPTQVRICVYLVMVVRTPVHILCRGGTTLHQTSHDLMHSGMEFHRAIALRRLS